MATFDQSGQNVGTQYNAETVNFGQVKTPDEFLQQLKCLQTEVDKAIEYFELALATFERALGSDHPSTKLVAANLAEAVD